MSIDTFRHTASCRTRISTAILIASLSVVAVDAVTVSGWWDHACPVRVPITISAGTTDRPAKIAFETTVDFRAILKESADSIGFRPQFLRIMEVDDSFRIVDSLVPFQYERDSSRDSKGMITLINNRLLPAGSSRSFHLYFSRNKPVGAGTEPLVRLGRYRGRRTPESISITTDDAQYSFMPRGAGFARLIDKEDNDWIGHDPTNMGPGGAWRGLPCLALEQFGHPGIPSPIKGLEITTELSAGPVKWRLRSFDKEGKWETIWNIYPAYATMEVVKAATDYWFAYEGAPGGVFDSAADYIMLPDSSKHSLAGIWTGDVPSMQAPYEWIGIGDETKNRILYMINHVDDTAPDLGRRLGEMAVVGFGRGGTQANYFQTPHLRGAGHRVTIGFAETRQFGEISQLIKAVMEPVEIKIGKAQPRPAGASSNQAGGAKARLSVIVSADSGHQFSGIGVNINSPGDYGTISTPIRKDIARRLYQEAKIRSIRLWSGGDVSRVREQYFTNGIVPDALEAGVTTIMLTGLGRQRGMDHARLYAGIIDTLRREGYPVDAVALLNKPNTNGSGTPRWDAKEVADGAKQIHEELQKRGLAEKVKLVAPETVEWWPRPTPEHASKYDYQEGDDMAYLTAICKDPAAVNSLHAFGLQSYGKGMTPEIRDLVRPMKKEFWITIAATDAMEDDAAGVDPCVAPIRAATLLSDLNLGASRWFYWSWWQLYNFHKAGPATSDSLGFSPTYHFLKNFSARIDSGAMVHTCISDPPMPSKFMDFNYTREPHIVAAAAKNPDGSWVIGIVNLTSLHAQHYASYQVPEEGRLYQVRVVFEGLKRPRRVDFSVSRTRGAAHTIVSGEHIQSKRGVLAVDVQPMELVVLRSGTK